MLSVFNIIPDSRISGPIVRVSRTASKLKENGYQTTVILPSLPNTTYDFIKRKSLDTKIISITKTPRLNDIFALSKWVLYLPRDTWRFSKLFLKHKPDIVHINSAFFLAPAIASKVLQIPIIWHINDTMGGALVSKILGIICKTIATKIVVASHSVASHYKIKRNSFSIIYPPVDYLRYPLRRKNKKKQTINVSIIANWSKIKGLDIFIKAASKVSKKFKNVEFYIVGSELETQKDYSKDLKKLINKLKMKDKLNICGHVDSDLIPNFLSRMDIHVLSSRSEGCPISLLEAMAASIPVVATNVGGVKESLFGEKNNHGGIIVPVNNVLALANAIEGLVINSDNAKMLGINGRKIVKMKFSLESCVKKHLDIYSSIL